MKKTISILITLTGLMSSILYGISTESILENFVEYKNTISLNDFKYIKDHDGIENKNKALYESKKTGKLWMVDKSFDAVSFRQYVVGDLFRLVLGNRAPELRLIKNSKGKLMMGSEFISEFQNLIDFFEISDPKATVKIKKKRTQTLYKCFPAGCKSEQFNGLLQINGGEDVLALMFLLGEMDGNAANLGLIPSQENPGQYEVAKIDHDEVGNGFTDTITLRSLAKIVFGEGKSYFTDFDYKKFDLNKIADAFDAIAGVPDYIWGGTIQARMRELSNENISDEIKGFLQQEETFLQILNSRKNRCRDFAISLRCEAAVRSGDWKAIEDLIATGFDVNTPIEYIHLDTSTEKQSASLVKLWYFISMGDRKAYNDFLKYTKQNGPISILEMAVRYDQFELIQKLTPLSNAQSIKEATAAATSFVGNQAIQTFLKNTKAKLEL